MMARRSASNSGAKGLLLAKVPSVILCSNRLLKKIHVLRYACSPRCNVLHSYASVVKSAGAWPLPVLSSLHQSFSDIASNRDGIPIPQPETDVQATQRQSAKFAGPKKRFYLCRSVLESCPNAFSELS